MSDQIKTIKQLTAADTGWWASGDGTTYEEGPFQTRGEALQAGLDNELGFEVVGGESSWEFTVALCTIPAVRVSEYFDGLDFIDETNHRLPELLHEGEGETLILSDDQIADLQEHVRAEI